MEQLKKENFKNLFLFAGDQKIEHLNKDFYGKNIPSECADPKHLFKIASKSRISAFVTQLGLIDFYARDFENIKYIVKLNSKTDLMMTKQADPISLILNSVEQVLEFKNDTNTPIIGVGYTVYLGSKYESQMLYQAAQAIFKAHQNGLLAVLWIYPRGEAVHDEFDPNIIAGAAGVGLALGADFVKVNPPQAKDINESAYFLKQATMAAGKTGVVCSGGKKETNKELFLERLYCQMNIGGTRGCAIGRNIYQNNLDDAIKFCEAIAKIVLDGMEFEQVRRFL